jgi:hypothetical protein
MASSSAHQSFPRNFSSGLADRSRPSGGAFGAASTAQQRDGQRHNAERERLERERQEREGQEHMNQLSEEHREEINEAVRTPPSELPLRIFLFFRSFPFLTFLLAR